MNDPVVSVRINGDARGLQAATEQARTALKSTTEGVESLASSIKALPGFGGIAASLGALASAGTIKALIGDTIAWAASMDDLAEKTGASVENLSGLSRVAKISGIDMGLVETGLIRLAKALSSSDEEAKGAGHALAFLGLKAEDLRKMDSAKALETVADAMAKYGDGTGKTALAIAIWGREGAQLLPLLKDLAEQHLRAGKLTTEQAAAAEMLEKAWRKTNYEGGQWAKKIVVDMIPALASLLDFVTETKAGIYQVGSSIAVVANDISVFAQVAAAAIAGGLTSEGQAHIKQLLTDRTRFAEAANEDMVKRLAMSESLRAKIDAALAGKSGNLPNADYTARDPRESAGKKASVKAFNGIQNEDDMLYAIQEAVRIRNRKAFDEADRAAEREAEALEKLRQKFAELAAQQRDALAVSQSWEYGTAKALDDYLANVRDVASQAGSFVKSMTQSVEDAFVRMATGGKIQIKDLFQTFAAEAARAFYRKEYAPTVASGIGALSGWLGDKLGLSGGYSASNIGSVGNFDVPMAAGGVFSSADLHNYANTIVSSPTLFKFAQGGAFSRGLMGEAGPEAIMPLTRGSNGKLGVQASGGGVQVIVNDQRTAASASPVSVEQGSSADGIQQIRILIRDEVRGQIASGQLDASMRASYGVARTLTKRG